MLIFSVNKLQKVTGVNDFEWIELPMNISAKEGYFVCKVIGESMNKKIPNGAIRVGSYTRASQM